MGNVTFSSPVGLGRRCSDEPFLEGHSWLPDAIKGNFFGPKIVYPRPISERSAYLHTEWDKWIAGRTWNPRIGVTGGVYPYKVFLTGNYPPGTRWSWFPNGATPTNPHLQLYHPNPPAGTYDFVVVVRDMRFDSAAVRVQLTIHDPNAATIKNDFRVFDPSAPGGGDGSPSAPFNSFSGVGGLWGTDYNNTTECPPNAIVILTGIATIALPALTNESAANAWDVGLNRPRQIIAIPGSDITFDLTTNLKHISTAIAGTPQCLLKGVRVSGQRGPDGVNQIRQAFFGDSFTVHDVRFANYDGTDTGNTNTGCIGGGGEVVTKNYVYIAGCKPEATVGTTGTKTNSTFLTFFTAVDGLFEANDLTDLGALNTMGYGMRLKHGSRRCEFRGNTALGDTLKVINTLISWNTAGSNAQFPLGIHEQGMMRFNNLRTTGEAVEYGVNSNENGHTIRSHRNTFVGKCTMTTPDVDEFAQCFRDIVEHPGTSLDTFGWTVTKLLPTITPGWGPLDGDASIWTDCLAGAKGSLVDANGIPLSPSNYGRGHYIP